MNSMPAMKRLKGRMKTAVTIRVKIYFYSTFRDKHPKGLQNKIPKHKNKTLTKPKSQIILFFFSCFCYSASMFGGDRRHQIPSLGQTRVRITMNISMDGSEEIFCCTVEWEMSACVWNKYLKTFLELLSLSSPSSTQPASLQWDTELVIFTLFWVIIRIF